ncbi:MAG: hypothetical protein KBD37_03840 [Burkholderiales bacterium]|nr:hypothetical protein [Burkholderiales bacterium]
MHTQKSRPTQPFYTQQLPRHQKGCYPTTQPLSNSDSTIFTKPQRYENPNEILNPKSTTNKLGIELLTITDDLNVNNNSTIYDLINIKTAITTLKKEKSAYAQENTQLKELDNLVCKLFAEKLDTGSNFEHYAFFLDQFTPSPSTLITILKKLNPIRSSDALTSDKLDRLKRLINYKYLPESIKSKGAIKSLTSQDFHLVISHLVGLDHFLSLAEQPLSISQLKILIRTINYTKFSPKEKTEANIKAVEVKLVTLNDLIHKQLIQHLDTADKFVSYIKPELKLNTLGKDTCTALINKIDSQTSLDSIIFLIKQNISPQQLSQIIPKINTLTTTNDKSKLTELNNLICRKLMNKTFNSADARGIMEHNPKLKTHFLDMLNPYSSLEEFTFIANQNLNVEQLQTLISKLSNIEIPQVINNITAVINTILTNLEHNLSSDNDKFNLTQLQTLTTAINILSSTLPPSLNLNATFKKFTTQLINPHAIAKLDTLTASSPWNDFIAAAELNLNESQLNTLMEKLYNKDHTNISRTESNTLNNRLFEQYIDNHLMLIQDYIEYKNNKFPRVNLSTSNCTKFIDNLNQDSDINHFIFIANQELSIDQIKALHYKITEFSDKENSEINDNNFNQLINDFVGYNAVNTSTPPEIDQLNDLLCTGLISKLNHKSTKDDYMFLFDKLDPSSTLIETLANKDLLTIEDLKDILDYINDSNNELDYLDKREFTSIIYNSLGKRIPEIYRLTNAINDDLNLLSVKPISYGEIYYVREQHKLKMPLNQPILLSKRDHPMLTRSVTLLNDEEILVHPYKLHNTDPQSKLVSSGANKITKASPMKIKLPSSNKALRHTAVVTVSQSPRANSSGDSTIRTKNQYLEDTIGNMAKNDGFTKITYESTKNGQTTLRVKYYQKDLGTPFDKVRNSLTHKEKINISRQIIAQFQAVPIWYDAKEENSLYIKPTTRHRKNLYKILDRLPGNDELVNPLDYKDKLKQYDRFNEANYDELINQSANNPNKLIPFEQILKSLNHVNNINFIDFNDHAVTYTTKNFNINVWNKNKNDIEMIEKQAFFAVCYLLYRMYEPQGTGHIDGLHWGCTNKPNTLILNPKNPFAVLLEELYQEQTTYSKDQFLKLLETVQHDIETQQP